MSDAAWCSVSATCRVTASAEGGSAVPCSSPSIAVLPATHSTRPTSFDSATAADAAPVGGYGVAENWARNCARSAPRASTASGSFLPSARSSASRATDDTAIDSLRRRLSCHGAGQTSRHAGTEKAAASVQPTNRGPTCDAGAATATGRTNVKSTAVVAVAAAGATVPAYRTAKPTSAIASTAATLWVDATVPSAMRPLLTAYRPM